MRKSFVHVGQLAVAGILLIVSSVTGGETNMVTRRRNEKIKYINPDLPTFKK